MNRNGYHDAAALRDRATRAPDPLTGRTWAQTLLEDDIRRRQDWSLAPAAAQLMRLRDDLLRDDFRFNQSASQRDNEMVTLRICDDKARLESTTRPPQGMTDIATLLAERAAAVIESNPHQWSARSCATCRTVSALIGRTFGCEARAKGEP